MSLSASESKTPASLPAPPPGKDGWPWTGEAPRLPATLPNGKPWPRISIVTPSYNQGSFIEETIRSVLLQGYPDLEYIVMDGGSTDQSVAIIKRYEPWLTYWVSAPDGGQTDALNKGFSRTTGQILNWLNSDDFLAPGALARVAEAFSVADENVGAIVGVGHYIDPQRRLEWTTFPPEITRATIFNWRSGGDFLQPACYFSRKAWDYVAPLPVELHYCMDVAIWLRLSERFRFERLPHSIAYAYLHSAAKTVAGQAHQTGEIALYFASQPDGFEHAKAILNHLIERELKPWRLRPLRRLARRIGLRRVNGSIQIKTRIPI